MGQASLLKTLYCQSSFNRTAPLRAVLENLFDGSCLEERLISQVLVDCQQTVASASQGTVLEKWRELLTLILVLKSKECLQQHIQQAVKSLRHLQRISLWHDHQLFSVYHALVSFLVGQPNNPPQLKQHSNGACPLEDEGYRLWAEIPHPLFHAELGTLWCLYGDATGQMQYVEAAIKLAEWQRNTLDHYYTSFVGLLSREGEASERLLLIHNFLLFNAVARTAYRSDLAFIAQKQLERLSEVADEESIDIPGYSIALEECFNEKSLPVVSGEYYLPSVLLDQALALAGSRSSESSAVATLYGGKSGMGCYHHQDVKVISFGPQYMPLGDCSGFGLEGSERFLKEHIKTLSSHNGEFTLEGTTRMSPHLSANGEESTPSGNWIESKQKLKNGMLSIEAKFQGLFDPKELIFSFFVKCKNCVIDGDRTIRPRSLNRYHGKAAPLKLHGAENSIQLNAGQGHEEMHVIPLGGGDNFWGADFLVAYALKDFDRAYSWQLSP